MNVAIDIVSDLVCPWCFIGKARLKGALALVKEKHPDVEFQINWLPYFLNPDTPKAGESYRGYLESKFGGAKEVDRIQALGAQEGTRTPTVLPPLGPEPSASTNFATWASPAKARF
jgi:predicted DsbA family dithiol-disulfide isomerase